jgi:hypothetical protein
MAAIASVAVPAYSADKKSKEADAPETTPSYYGPQPATENVDLTMYARIREEGFHHSHVMEFGGALADGIGPRLTGSPNMAKANAWTCETLTKIGLENAHLEDWGEFGMGWQQINTWARMVSPDPEPLWMQAAPWSPSTNGPVTGEAVYIDARSCCLVGCGRLRTLQSLCSIATRRQNSRRWRRIQRVKDAAANRIFSSCWPIAPA